jgi:hypothetical protein
MGKRAGLAFAARMYATKPSAIPGVLDGSGWDPPAITPR